MSTASPAYFEIIEFIAAGTTPEAVAHFLPSPEAQRRVAALIERRRKRDCLRKRRRSWTISWSLSTSWRMARRRLGKSSPVASDVSEQVRSEVARRAGLRCEYCLIDGDAGFPHQVDHIVSRKHGGISEFENLAFACILCTRHEGSDVASIIRKREKWFGYSIPASIVGQIISVLTPNSLSRSPTLHCYGPSCFA